MNSWVATGRLVAEPELRHTQNDKAVCSFKIAVDRARKIEGQPTADFFDCVAWENTGTFVSKWFTKGKMIAVRGRMQNKNWTDNEGKKHYGTEVFIEQAEFCGDKGNGNNDSKSGDTQSGNRYSNNTSSNSEYTDVDEDGELPFN